MAYYEDWDDEEEFFANSPVDEAMNAFTKAIMDNVKKSILDELERLRAENEELKEFRDQKDKMEREINAAKWEYKRKVDQAVQEAKRMRLFELMGENVVTGWGITWKFEYIHEKCDKCDDQRKIHFTSPSGKDMTEPCPYCSKQYRKYETKELQLSRFSMNKYHRDKVWMYFINTENTDYDECTYTNTYNPGKPFDQVNAYRIAFLDQETAEKYCEWRNQKERAEKINA